MPVRPRPIAPVIGQPSPPQEKNTDRPAAWLQYYLELADILLNGKPDGGKQATEDNR